MLESDWKIVTNNYNRILENFDSTIEEEDLNVYEELEDTYLKIYQRLNRDREDNKILMKEIAGTVEKQMEKIGERDRKIEQKVEATNASVIAAGNKKEQKIEAVGRESIALDDHLSNK
ncbi:unnamed protein product [Pieris macdunnoughi]|uniref:Uncharacterized protein n=1 Tax=Pieris macdunnoughi TaxID=345717 RepID=A0A821XJS1_9NEOP|nr:unnamed protein product [Pieris macdunnoughi]